MIQIITRKEGSKGEVSNIPKGRPQISYNSDGHVVVRLVHDQETETLVVFDQQASNKILSFANMINGNQTRFPF